MALSSQSVWEVRPTTGSDTNGGGYAWGTDSVSISSKTDLVIASTTTNVSSTGYGFTSADVGRSILITAGTGFIPGMYQIQSVASGVATLDRSAGTAGSTAGSYTIYNGIDYSQQGSANTTGSNKSTTDAVAAGTTTITSATAAFTADIVGNIIYLQGGTGSLTAGWYEVKTYVSATSITVDRTVATGTGITMNIGGALQTITKAGVLYVAGGNRIWVKAEATITTAANIVLGTSNINPSPTLLTGYTSVRGDNGRVTVQATGAISLGVFKLSGAGTVISNFIVDCNTQTTTIGIYASSNYISAYNCLVKNSTNNSIYFNVTGGNVVNCEVTAQTVATSGNIYANGSGNQIIGCYIHDTVGVGILASCTGGFVGYNIVYNTSGTLAHGIQAGSAGPEIMFNTIHATGGNNIQFGSDYPAVVWGNILSGAGRSTGTNGSTCYGLGGGGTYAARPVYDGNAFYNPLTGNKATGDGNAEGSTIGPTSDCAFGSSPYRSSKDITLTASPFVNVGTDFSLNSTAGGGAACKGTAPNPGSWPSLTSVGAPSYGAVQAAGSSGMLFIPGMAGGMES